ncbi:MAG: hypothetical protein ACTSPI_00845 [Candidatus Heimdallarchaeaceae archaeon]
MNLKEKNETLLRTLKSKRNRARDDLISSAKWLVRDLQAMIKELEENPEARFYKRRPVQGAGSSIDSEAVTLAALDDMIALIEWLNS